MNLWQKANVRTPFGDKCNYIHKQVTIRRKLRKAALSPHVLDTKLVQGFQFALACWIMFQHLAKSELSLLS